MRVFKAYSSVIGDSFWWLVAVVWYLPLLGNLLFFVVPIMLEMIF